MSQPAGKIWQNHEIEAIILDYITMLQDELEGKRIVKARHNERLQGITGRSRASIGYKYQNISAVMEELGLPFINGYKPARHYQQALFMCVVKYIDYHNLERSLANIEGTTNASHEDLVYEDAPGIEEDLQTKEPDICNFYKHNPAIRDEKLRKLGKAGEKFLLRAEKNRLKKKKKEDLASRVRWIAEEDGDGAGYDILSFSIRGEKRLLEVKTTNGPATTPFWISANELRVSNEKHDEFRIVRIYNFKRQPTAYRLKPPLDNHIKLIAKHYLATFKQYS